MSLTKDYSKKKRQIQAYFYSKVKSRSSVVALAGNNLDLHIKDITSILSKRGSAYVYDLSIEVLNKFKYLEKDYNVQLINDNIMNCRIERFIDVDLMRTLGSTQGLIYYLFNEQYNKFKYGAYTKAGKTNTFMFTYSLRGNRVNVNTLIKSLLETKNITVESIETITYRDGAPMATTQIQWKV